jgi:hypothetical protein
MAVNDYTAHVPYAELAARFGEQGGWTCVACRGRVEYKGFGHEPRPRVPLFECQRCGRRSDGCQTFEGHHVLYGYCALEDRVNSRCGHWLCSWERARGECPVCGGQGRDERPARAHTRPGRQFRHQNA